MNFLSMLLLILFVGACEQDHVNDLNDLDQKFAKSRVVSETTYLELHLHQYFLENELTLLNEERSRLIAEIESGNDEKIPELEEVQQQINTYKGYHEYNEEFIARIDIPRLPPKPNPCDRPGEDNNCPVPAVFEDVFKILLHNEQGDVSMTLTDNNNGKIISELVGLEYSPDYEGLLSYQMAVDHVGDAVLHITKYSELMDAEITYAVNVKIE
nr:MULTISPECIES: hypothetical protein [unclassified Allomuricauda]